MTFKQEYHLIVNWGFVNKKLKKYPKNIKTMIKRNITLLKFNPKKGDKIESFKSVSLWKKRYQEIEVYYTIEDISVVVLDVRYIGKVELNNIVTGIKSGSHNKKTTTKQQRTIKQQKKNFNQKYR